MRSGLLGRRAPPAGQARGAREGTTAGAMARRVLASGRVDRLSASRDRVTTVSIEDHVVRLAVFQDGRAVAWGSSYVDPSPGATAAGDDLRDLVAELAGRAGGVVMDVPFPAEIGLQFTLPKAKKGLQRQMVEAEALGTVPFAADEADIHWRTGPVANGADARHIDVQAVVVPRAIVDARVAALKGARARPAAAYGQASALAAALGQESGIVIHLTATAAWTVLVADGVAKAVAQVAAHGPREADEGEEGDWAARTARAVQRFREAFHGADEATPAADLRVVVTGEHVTHQALLAGLRLRLGALPLLSGGPAAQPSAFDPAEYAVNVGLAAAYHARREARGPFDLLAERHRPATLPRRPAAVLIGLAAGALVLGLAAPQVTKAESRVTAAQAVLQQLQQQERVRGIEDRGARAARDRISTMEAAVRALEEERAAFRSEEAAFTRRVALVLTRAADTGIQVLDLSIEEGTLTINGQARDPQSVVEYTSALRYSGLFKDIQLGRVENNSLSHGSTAAFRIRASYGDAMAERPTPMTKGPSGPGL